MKLIKTMIIGALLASLTYAETKNNTESVGTKINKGSLTEALNDIKYWGVMRYKGENYKNAYDKEQYNDVDYALFLSTTMGENLEWGLTIGSESESQANDKDFSTDRNKNVTMNIDMLQFHATYTHEAFKVQAGQMTLRTPLTDNSPINPETGVGVIGSYSTDNLKLSAGYFQDLEFAQYYHNLNGPVTELSESAIYTLGAVLTYDDFKFQGWAIKAEDVYDSLLFAEAGVKYPNYELKLQGIHSTLDDDFGGESGIYYAGEAKAKYKNISGRIGFSVNDEDQSWYSLNGKDSSGLIEIGGEMKSSIDNEADTSSVFGDVMVTMGKFNVQGGYAKASMGPDDLTEYYGQVGYNFKPNIRTRILYSDIDSDNDELDIQLVRLEFLYRF